MKQKNIFQLISLWPCKQWIITCKHLKNMDSFTVSRAKNVRFLSRSVKRWYVCSEMSAEEWWDVGRRGLKRQQKRHETSADNGWDISRKEALSQQIICATAYKKTSCRGDMRWNLISEMICGAELWFTTSGKRLYIFCWFAKNLDYCVGVIVHLDYCSYGLTMQMYDNSRACTIVGQILFQSV